MICPVCDYNLPVLRLDGTMEFLCPRCCKRLEITIRLADPGTVHRERKFDLIVNLNKSFVLYKGHSIPTTPPHNLMPQQLNALYILGKNANIPITPEDIFLQMEEEGLLTASKNFSSGERLAPEAKHLRHGIISAFKENMDDFPKSILNNLIEAVSRPPRLKLNIPQEKVECIGLV